MQVTVDWLADMRMWTECIRIWCITLDHKKYEEAIAGVQVRDGDVL